MGKGNSGNKSKPKSRSSSASRASADNCSSDCGSCNTTIQTGRGSVECEVCLRWYHLECVDLSKDDLATIGRAKGIHWYCKNCDATSYQHEKRLNSLEASLTKFLDDQTHSLTDRIAAVETQLQEVVESQQKATLTYSEVVTKLDASNKTGQAIQEQVSKQFSTLKTEIKTDNRAKNLVVFGMSEASADGEEDSLSESVGQLLKQCSIRPDVSSSECFRLGQKKTDKSRPVKVVFKSESDKWEALRRINNMKQKGIFARLDLTKEEQERDFRLRQELKQTREKNPNQKFKIMKNKVVAVGPQTTT